MKVTPRNRQPLVDQTADDRNDPAFTNGKAYSKQAAEQGGRNPFFGRTPVMILEGMKAAMAPEMRETQQEQTASLQRPGPKRIKEVLPCEIEPAQLDPTDVCSV